MAWRGAAVVSSDITSHILYNNIIYRYSELYCEDSIIHTQWSVPTYAELTIFNFILVTDDKLSTTSIAL